MGGPTTNPIDPPDRLLAAVSIRGPLVLHLPGIGGPRMCDRHMLAGLRDGGVKATFVICDWTENDPGISALQDYAGNRRQAQRISDLILAHIAADPDSPIFLTAHSGGCGLAVWALEKLPSDVRLPAVLLIAPALSPTYDLTRALRHVDGRMYAFSSTLDTVVLDTGTRLFGTIDGVQTAAAGFGGFVEPAGADPSIYQRLVQRSYQRDWARYNDFGDHIGGMSRPFAKAVLAPLFGPVAASTTQRSEPSAHRRNARSEIRMTNAI